jgi:hypothetical protein
MAIAAWGSKYMTRLTGMLLELERYIATCGQPWEFQRGPDDAGGGGWCVTNAESNTMHSVPGFGAAVPAAPARTPR